MNRKVAIRLVVVLAVVSLAVFASRRRQAAAVVNPVVQGSGTVEATEIDVAAEGTGRLIDVRVEEGDQVVAGQLLAVIKGDALAAELARAEAAADTARMRLADVEAGARPEEVRARAARLREALATLETAQATARTAQEAWQRPTDLTAAADAARAKLQAARASSRQAQAQLDEARHGPREQEIAEARAAVATADQAVAAARAGLRQAEEAAGGAGAELGPVERAAREREAADTQVSAATTRLAAAEAALRAAQARRDQVQNDPRPQQREQIRRRIDSAQAGLLVAEEQAARDQRLFDAGAIAKKQLEASVGRRDQAQAALQEAQAALADLEMGAREPERREVEAAVARAEVELEGARRDLANARREQAILVASAQQQAARASSAVPQAEARRDQAAAVLEQAQRQREQAAARLDLLLAGTRVERVAQAAAGAQVATASETGAADALRHARQAQDDRFLVRQQLEVARGQVAAATARVDAAQADLDLALAGATKEKRGVAQGEVQQAEAAQQLASTRLVDTAIRAPRSGTVSEVILREGETVTPGSVVLRMLDLDHLWVRIYLPLRQFGKVVRGQAAAVSADAYPGRTYRGSVLTVSDNAEFTPKNTQTVEERVKQVFWVKVEVGRGENTLKPGMPVDVTLDTGQAP